MEIHVLNFTLCALTMMACLPQYEAYGDGNHMALLIIYDKYANLYALVDEEILDTYVSFCIHILTCPYTDQRTGKTFNDRLSIVNFRVLGIHYDVCTNPYQPSMIQSNTEASGFNVGFTFTGDQSGLRDRKMPDFSSILDNTKEGQRLHIYDIEIRGRDFHPTETRHRIVSYKPFLHLIPEPCETFVNFVDDGMPTNRIKDMKNFYSENRQKELLKNYEHQDDIFVATQLTPIDDFTDTPSRLATCTYYNTVPIWSPIAKLVKQIELYIQRVADAFPVNTLEVITRTFGILKLPLQKNQSIEEWVYLGSNGEIPVPRAFLKIVHYRLAYPDNNSEGSDMPTKYNDYYMILGVHNTRILLGAVDTLMQRDDQLVWDFDCKYDICSKYGWWVGNSLKEKSKIFCCDVADSKSLLSLGLNEFQGAPLDLNEIPVKLAENGDTERFIQVPFRRV